MNKKKMINQCQEEAEEANKLIVEDKDQEEKILQDFTAVLNQLLLDHHHKNSIRMTYNNSSKLNRKVKMNNQCHQEAHLETEIINKQDI